MKYIKAHITDKQALSVIKPETLQAWIKAKHPDANIQLYPSGAENWCFNDFVVLVPLRQDFRDYAARVSELIETLALIHEVSELDLYDEFLNLQGQPAEALWTQLFKR